MTRAVVSLLVVGGAASAAYFIPPQLGLDLRGGTQITLETHDAPNREADQEATDQAVEVLRQRVDSLGVAEATLVRSGENRIIVELPGVQDPSEAAELIGRTAQLSFHPVLSTQGAGGTGIPGLEEVPPAEGEAPPPEGEVPDSQRAADPELLAQADGESAEPSAEESEPASSASPSAEASEDPAAPEEPALSLPDPTTGANLDLGPATITGTGVTGAEATLDQYGANWMVNVSFGGDSREAWRQLTADAACAMPGDPARQVAIVLDDAILSAPQVTEETACGVGQGGGSTSITGDFTQAEAENLAVLIEGGALPVPVERIEMRTVGPTLGAEAIEASMWAAVIGIVLTAVYIVFVYRLAGFLASLALGLYTLIAYAALVLVGATLTLPGLAGFVLAIGMAIDANVLMFERSRERYLEQQEAFAKQQQGDDAAAASGDAKKERRRLSLKDRVAPPNLYRAFAEGSRNAFSAVLDSNITTILAAGLLFFLASGPVRGFGVTLALGTLASMISALVIARVLVEWAMRTRVVNKRPNWSGIAKIGAVRRWLIERAPDIMGKHRRLLAVTGIIAVIAVAGVLVRPLNFGVEFTGGRVMDFAVEQEVSVEDARAAVSDTGFPGAVVQESGENEISVRTQQITDDEATRIEEALAEVGGGATRESDELIGPSLGQELRTMGLIALAVALLAQLVYLAVRFRWTFGLATMIALALDVVVVIGLFAWLGRPIDGVFLAGLLSIIGYSVNDSVVVFDRVRDEWRNNPDRPFITTANAAVLNTLPRTVSTGIGGFAILGALAVLGGDSLTDFSIALLAGLFMGMLSTVITAVPLAIVFERFAKSPPPHARGDKPRKREQVEIKRDHSGAVV
ncbi:protein translocase subunit SecD [Allonocardiopsis opalescens]|uniref:protein translocase subunit SecD n=1 Tax=Allonocardiopsis opalescens TaxID=1144618 RepID=UPI001FE92C01|nr:protein translocase subunit SecD [Allonocardiopsis opalescens]